MGHWVVLFLQVGEVGEGLLKWRRSRASYQLFGWYGEDMAGFLRFGST